MDGIFYDVKGSKISFVDLEPDEATDFVIDIATKLIQLGSPRPKSFVNGDRADFVFDSEKDRERAEKILKTLLQPILDELLEICDCGFCEDCLEEMDESRSFWELVGIVRETIGERRFATAQDLGVFLNDNELECSDDEALQLFGVVWADVVLEEDNGCGAM